MKKKIFVNIGSSVLMQTFQIIVNIILPPLIIYTFGSEVNGLSSSIKQLLGYVSIIGLGISSVSTQALYKPFLDKDENEINAILNSTNKMFTRAGFIYSLILIIVAFIYPLLIKTSIEYMDILLVIIAIGLSGVSEFFVVGKYRSLLYADQKVFIYNLIQTIGLVLSFLIAYTLIKLNQNIVIVQLGISTIYIFRVILIKYYVNKKYKFLDNKVKNNDIALNKKNDALIHQLSGLAVGSTQVIFLSFFLGLNYSSIYSVYNIVFSGFFSILSLSINSISPFIGRTYASNDLSKSIYEYNNYEKVFTIIITFIYSMCGALIYSFISIYTQNADIIYQDYLLSILFVLVGIFNTIRLPGQMLINVAGHYKETKNRAIIEGIICVTLQLVLIPLFGIYGCLIATLCSSIWRAFDIMIYARKLLKQNIINVFKYVLSTLSIIIIVYLLNREYNNSPVGNFYEWIISAIKCCLITAPFVLCQFILFYFNKFKKITLKKHI